MIRIVVAGPEKVQPNLNVALSEGCQRVSPS
jgi:hypothetical protein